MTDRIEPQADDPFFRYEVEETTDQSYSAADVDEYLYGASEADG